VAPVSAAVKARIVTRSARATHTLGARLGRLLGPGDVVALVGDLGAGKTQLVRGACAGAGVRPEDVSSPSFAIVATYAGRLPVHHADLYRIADEEELYGTGFGDLVGGDGALLVEWADRIPSALPAEKLTIRLGHDARRPDVRHVEVEGVGERHGELATKLAKRGRGRGRPGTKVAAGSRSGSRSKSKSTSTSTSTSTSKKKPRTPRP
jgi:tRNA threonylcarbamoyladenosine biosynthesis protein TsaE